MDVKKLGVVVEQKGIAPTAKNLESLAKSSDKAAPAVERLSSSLGSFKSINLDSFASKLQDTSTAIKEVKAATSGMADMAKNIGGLSINLTNIANATDRISGKTKELDSFTASIRNLKIELEGMKGLSGSLNNLSAGASTRRTASSGTSGSSGEAEGLTKAQQRLQTQIERTAMMAGKTKSEYLALRAAQEGITSSTSPFIAKIAEVENKFKTGTMSTKQYNAAMRMVPAQFTDIATQLAGGQNPMLILMQQGGQLKDMFGGVGGAIKAMGAYLVTLLANPLVLLAAGIAAVGYSVYSASKEINDFNKASIASNGIIGLSTQGFYDMRDAIAATGVSKSLATEALTEIAKNGQISAASVEGVGIAAAKMSKVTGVSVETAVGYFAELRDRPLDTLDRLSKSYNFLDYNTRESIKSLAEQGNTAGATALATETLEKAIKRMADKAKEDLKGTAWLFDTLKKAADGVVEAFRGFGARTEKESIDALTKSIEEREAAIERMKKGGIFGSSDPKSIAAMEAGLVNMKAQKKAIEDASKASSDAAAKRAAEIDTENAKNAARKKFESLTEGSLKLQAEKEKEKGQRQAAYNELVKQGVATKEDEIMLAQSLAAIDKKYKQTPDRSAERAQKKFDAYAKEVAAVESVIYSLQEENANIEANGLAYDKIGEHAKAAAKWRLQAATAGVSPEAKAHATSMAALEERAAAQQDIKADMLSNTKAYEAYNEVARKNAQDVADLNSLYEQEQKYITMTTKEKTAAQALYANEVAMNKELLELRIKYKNAQVGSVEEGYLNASVANTKAAYAEKAKLINANLALQEQELSWQQNMTVATKQYAYNLGTYNQQVQAGFINVYGTVESALNDFVTGTNTSFKDLTVSVLKQISIMMAKIAMMKFAMAAIGMFSSGTPEGTTIGNGTYSASSDTVFANGGAFGTGVAKFAKGSAFTNSVVSRPTPIKFASGGAFSQGVMGEAGPEAVMPLTRTANGNLGVETTGTGGVQNNVSVNITMNGDGSASTSTTSDQSGTKRFAEIMAQVAKNTILQEQRPGGSLATR